MAEIGMRIFLLLVASSLTFTCDAWNLDNLGEQISSSVQNSLRGLDGLGARINNDVERALRPLENLGDNIRRNVHHGLEPVRIMQARIRIMTGDGGTTIATYQPSGRVFMIKNGRAEECKNVDTVETEGCENIERDSKKEDYCFRFPQAIVNDYLCFAPGTSSVLVNYNNGQFTCSSPNSNEITVMTVDEFNKLCEDVATKVHYRYTTDLDFENPGNKFDCSKKGTQTTCTLSRSLKLTNQGGTIITNNGISVHYSQ